MLRERMANRPTHYNTKYKNDLSPREREVLSLATRGRTNAEIAESLGLAFDTVKMHMSGILGKLGVDSREEAATYWRNYNSLGGRLGRTWNAIVGIATSKAATIAGASTAVVAAALAAVAIALSLNGNDNTPETENAEPALPAPRVGSAVALPEGSDRPIVSAGWLWMGSKQGLAAVELSSGRIEYIPGTRTGRQYVGIALAGGLIWGVAEDGAGLLGFDPATRRQSRRIELGFTANLREAWLFGTADALYISAWEIDSLFRFDMASGKMAASVPLYRPKGMVMAAGSIWVPLGRTDEVARLNPATLEVQAVIPLDIVGENNVCGTCVQQIVATADSIWVVSDSGPRPDRWLLSRVDIATNTHVVTLAFPAAGGIGVAADDAGNVWVPTRPNGETYGELVRVDAATGSIVERIRIDPPRPPFTTVTPKAVRIEGDTLWVVTDEGDAYPVRRTP